MTSTLGEPYLGYTVWASVSGYLTESAPISEEKIQSGLRPSAWSISWQDHHFDYVVIRHRPHPKILTWRKLNGSYKLFLRNISPN
jgi:hypothetical protein